MPPPLMVAAVVIGILQPNCAFLDDLAIDHVGENPLQQIESTGRRNIVFDFEKKL
jgi:hypothetical protein